jgi:ferredoxin
MHNIYACREIIGNRHFRGDNTIEAQYALVEKAKTGLSGIENHGRLIMSTEYGKMEVLGVSGNEVLLRMNRFVHGKKPRETIVKVDLNKLEQGQKFYWLTDDIIKVAVAAEGQKVLGAFTSDKQPSFIKHLKDKAAGAVYAPDLNLLTDVPATATSAEIEVILKHQPSEVIPVRFSGDKPPTLASVLAQHGHVEAACQEKLSCSTCVGVVQTNDPGSDPLPAPTEDELDVIDMVAKNGPLATDKETGQLRAGCNIRVKPGVRYTFTPLEGV